MNPKIDYAHVMKELSVNRNNPLEVVRELISNSYDAKADNIAIASMKSLSGLLYFDDGEGLGPTKKINGITPYEAFFSIGKSTKIQGGNDNTIGYKCQGSKLCFASNRLMIITKTQNEKGWRIFHIDNPRDNLDNQTDITPTNTQKPWQDLKSFLKNGGKDVVEILNSFGQ